MTQLRRIIEQSDLPPPGQLRQTLMFSATFAPAIQTVAAKYLQKSFVKVF